MKSGHPYPTVANENFIASVQDSGTALSYLGLQATVTQEYIHVAPPGVNGSIIIWLCQLGAICRLRQLRVGGEGGI
jgi:hypothetical protein